MRPCACRFQKSIDVDFIFEINQEIRFVLYDIDDALSTRFNVELKPFNMHDHDLLGFVQTTLGDIVGSRNCQMTSALMGKKGKKEKVYGTIIILAEEISYAVVRYLLNIERNHAIERTHTDSVVCCV